jgi:Arc/MetJ-type ribon-helix-helix transcriptional regulator
MNRQNVTLSLPKSLLKKAKVIAAGREKSLSELLRESLEEKVREANGYKKARQRQLKLLKEGLDLGTKGEIVTTRDEVHVRQYNAERIINNI